MKRMVKRIRGADFWLHEDVEACPNCGSKEITPIRPMIETAGERGLVHCHKLVICPVCLRIADAKWDILRVS